MKTTNIILLLFLTIFTSLNAATLRIELKELSKDLSKYKIIDVRDEEIYSEGHLHNALNLNVNLTYEHKKIDGKITQPMKMQKILRDLGLDINDNIVIYDDGTFFDASRVFWTLEVYGFQNVKLLNGGYEQWKNSKFPVTTKIPKTTKSKYIANINNKRLATKFSTLIATKNPKHIIVDARNYNSYIGKESVAKRFGHIPKAIHIPANHNIDTTQQLAVLKSKNSLEKLYGKIEKDKKVVIYCAIGRIASTNYFALRELGYDVSNYDASWKEWGNDFNLPIINRSKNQ